MILYCTIWASRSRAAFAEHVVVPGRSATVDVYRCHTAVLGPYIAGCRSRSSGRREGRHGTDRLPRAAGTPEIPVPHSKEPTRDHTTYVRQALENIKTVHYQTLAKAAPDLFAFILYYMEPTNNHSERTMRFVVGHRNVRMQVCGGAIRCGRASVRGDCAAPRYTMNCGGALPRGPWRIHAAPKRIRITIPNIRHMGDSKLIAGSGGLHIFLLSI